MNDARRLMETIYFSGPINLSTFNAMRFDKNRFTCQCEKEKRKGLRVSYYYWLFSSYVTAVKGLVVYLLNLKTKTKATV